MRVNDLVGPATGSELDVYGTPEYGESAMCFEPGRLKRFETADGRMSFIAVERDIPRRQGLCDLISTYGYCSFETQHEDSDANQALRELHAIAHEMGYISYFFRCNPLDRNLPYSDAALGLDVVEVGTTYSVNVSYSQDELWAGAKGRHRTAVRKARTAGLEPLVISGRDAVIDRLHDFVGLYNQTMGRIGADASYLVDETNMRTLASLPSGAVRMVEVWKGSQLAASALFLCWGERSHYHLAGSDGELSRDGANNLMLQAAIDHLVADPRIRLLHLGGGRTRGDGLDRFKASFATDEHPFMVGRMVLDSRVYEELSANTDRQDDFFPAYR